MSGRTLSVVAQEPVDRAVNRRVGVGAIRLEQQRHKRCARCRQQPRLVVLTERKDQFCSYASRAYESVLAARAALKPPLGDVR
jgi:hypothetical protein